MARLQVYDQNQVAPGQAPGVAVSSPNAGVGDIAAQQLKQLGGAVQQAGQVGASIVTDMVEKQNEVRVTEALTEAQRLMLERQKELTSLRGVDALMPGDDGVSPAERVRADLNRDFGQVGQRLKLNRTQQERFNLAAQPLTMRFNATADQHIQRENEAYQESVYTTAVATNQQMILADPNDAVNVGMATAGIERATRQRADFLGMTPEATELAVLTNVGEGHVQAITAMADENPRAAQEYYERNSTWMTTPQQQAARDRFVPAMRTANMESWVEREAADAPPPPPGEPGARYESPIPGGRVTSGYGSRPSFTTANGQRASSNHDGMDIAAAEGTPVRAVAGGRVVRAGPNGGYGNFVEIEHGDGTRTAYAHLQGFDVQVGDNVTSGQAFARVGSTGNSTGPHLHLRARRADGTSFDPAELFDSEAPAAAQSQNEPASRRELYRRADEQFGNNPVELEAARRAIDSHFSREEGFRRAEEEQARDSAYAYIEQNRAMPPASMLAALPPGMRNTMQNYHDALVAPPTVRTDPALELALISNPEAWANMSPEEFVAKYGRQMTNSDLIGYVGTLARGSNARMAAMRSSAEKATVLPVQEFSRAWTGVSRLAGLPPVDDKDTEAVQQRQVLMNGLQTWVLARQAVEGRQLTEQEITVELNSRLARLAWEAPRGLFSGGGTRYAVNFETMQPGDRSFAREQLRRQGVSRPTDNQIWEYYSAQRVGR